MVEDSEKWSTTEQMYEPFIKILENYLVQHSGGGC